MVAGLADREIRADDRHLPFESLLVLIVRADLVVGYAQLPCRKTPGQACTSVTDHNLSVAH